MDLLLNVLLFLYILGLAAVFGGFFHQMYEKHKNVTQGMFIGGVVQLVAFLGILAYRLSKDVPFDTDSVVMLIITLIIGALAIIFRNKSGDNMPVWLGLGVLSALAFALTFVW